MDAERREQQEMKMRWLISYCYQNVVYSLDRMLQGPENDAIELSDEHPALWLLRHSESAGESPYPNQGQQQQTVTKIVRIYSAIEVPDGLLTEEQAESLE